MKITWDEPKRLATLVARDLDFAIRTEDFFAGAFIAPAKHDRLIAIGHVGRRCYAVVFKPLGTEAVSIISLRSASEKERLLLCR